MTSESVDREFKTCITECGARGVNVLSLCIASVCMPGRLVFALYHESARRYEEVPNALENSQGCVAMTALGGCTG
jgi:hypothetical protein